MNVAYYGALRVAELASLTWDQVIPRETGEVQLALVGKGDKPRHVLLPADVAKDLRTMRSGASGSARVFPITERRINYILKAVAKRAGVSPNTSPHWLRHAHASHAIDNGTPITMSYRAIAEKLEAAGYLNERGALYNPASVKRMVEGRLIVGER